MALNGRVRKGGTEAAKIISKGSDNLAFLFLVKRLYLEIFPKRFISSDDE